MNNFKKLTLSIYHSKEFGRLRIVNGESYEYYNLKDVCRILNFNQCLVTKMIREQHNYNVVTFEFGEGQKMNFLTPDGLLQLYLKKEEQDSDFAHRFYEWCYRIRCNERGVEYAPFGE